MARTMGLRVGQDRRTASAAAAALQPQAHQAYPQHRHRRGLGNAVADVAHLDLELRVLVGVEHTVAPIVVHRDRGHPEGAPRYLATDRGQLAPQVVRETQGTANRRAHGVRGRPI